MLLFSRTDSSNEKYESTHQRDCLPGISRLRILLLVYLASLVTYSLKNKLSEEVVSLGELEIDHGLGFAQGSTEGLNSVSPEAAISSAVNSIVCATVIVSLLKIMHLPRQSVLLAILTCQFTPAVSQSPTYQPTSPMLCGSNGLFDLNNLNGQNGFSLYGEPIAAGSLGRAFSNVGDFNGDGIDDIIVGAAQVDASYMLFGSSGIGGSGVIELANLNGTNGFSIRGFQASDQSGEAVSGIGDFNNDSYKDIIICAPYRDTNGANTGSCYVIFGGQKTWGSTFELGSINATNGLVINGLNSQDLTGKSVSAAGDINNDGIADIIIGASSANSAYIIFGASIVGINGTLELSNLDGTNGFVINGVTSGDGAGWSVSTADDFNSDGISDVLIGARSASPNAKISAGITYVVFGSGNIWPSVFNLSELDGTNGFSINGANGDDNFGYSVSKAGDFNNDGVADIIIGAPNADMNADMSGSIFVLFGGTNIGSTGSFEVSNLNATDGFVINGAIVNDRMGSSVSYAGDINADGVGDIIFSSYTRSSNSGNAFIIFGGSGVGISGEFEQNWSLNGENGFVMERGSTEENIGVKVGYVGDVNNDGIDDVMIGAPSADPNAVINAGKIYAVFCSSQISSYMPTSEPTGQPSVAPSSAPSSSPTVSLLPSSVSPSLSSSSVTFSSSVLVEKNKKRYYISSSKAPAQTKLQEKTKEGKNQQCALTDKQQTKLDNCFAFESSKCEKKNLPEKDSCKSNASKRCNERLFLPKSCAEKNSAVSFLGKESPGLKTPIFEKTLKKEKDQNTQSCQLSSAQQTQFRSCVDREKVSCNKSKGGLISQCQATVIQRCAKKLRLTENCWPGSVKGNTFF